MENIKALIFDLGGTVFDWENTVRERIEQLAVEHGQPVDGASFAKDWGDELFRVHAMVRCGDLHWMDFDCMHVIALNSLQNAYPLLGCIDDPMELVKGTWHRLKAQPGAADGINRLRKKFTVVPLTNLSWASIVSSSKVANVQWDGILSCEFLGYYKPARQSYLRGVDVLGLKPHECIKVSYDGLDLEAAQSAGLATARLMSPVTLTELEGFGESNSTFDLVAKDFPDLCNQLGA